MKTETANAHKKIAQHLLQEVVNVSSAVHQSIISVEQANLRLSAKVDNCIERFGLPSVREGLKLALEALEKSAPHGNLTFHKNNEPDLIVPVICAGITEYFATCIDY